MRKFAWLRIPGLSRLVFSALGWIPWLLTASPLIDSAKEAYTQERFQQVIELLRDDPASAGEEALVAGQLLAAAHQRRGEQHFQNGRIQECLADFNRVVALSPEQAPHHWQRGIALYYAGLFAEGAAQFELHRTVNPEDVENSVWHFLCSARSPGGSVEMARAKLIPVREDGRPPMKEIFELFAGKISPKQVLSAGKAGGDQSRFYADLYVGLYLEALGKKAESLQLIAQAAVNPKANHYMGDVARTHLLVREGGVQP